MSALCLLATGWTDLPILHRHTGTANKLHICAGCHQAVSNDGKILRCTFREQGFTINRQFFLPCRVSYHIQCFRAGTPFESRRRDGAGLTFPEVGLWGSFVCELCTVRAVLGRELTGPHDEHLLCYERIRVLDMAHYWATGTHKTYQLRLQMLRRFESKYEARILQPTRLMCPPHSPDIPLMWAQLAYGLRRGSSRRTNNTDIDPPRLAFSTIRSVRSAASQFFAWDAMVSRPSGSFLDEKDRLIYQPVRPTDSLSYSLFSGGMRARIGDESRPAMPLLDRHVRSLDLYCEQAYRNAATDSDRRLFALAGSATLLLWLGWLRSSEVFGLRWCDVEITTPANGPTLDLPPGIGVVACRLQPETKSSRDRTADCFIAYQTVSGYELGKWLTRAALAWQVHDPSNYHGRIFRSEGGTTWTSLYYRSTFLYPHLHALQKGRDPYLVPFTGDPGNSLEDKFWSLHCFRRGARSHVSRGGIFGKARLRRASPDEVYEHARWRRRRSGEAIDKLYQEWTVRDKLRITLLCM